MSFSADVAYWLTFGALLVSACGHAAHLEDLQRVVIRHRVVPANSARWAALFLAFSEWLLAAALIVAPVVGVGARAATWAASGFFALLSVYAFAALQKADAGTPCGCGGAETALSPGTVVRAGVLALMAAFATSPHWLVWRGAPWSLEAGLPLLGGIAAAVVVMHWPHWDEVSAVHQEPRT